MDFNADSCLLFCADWVFLPTCYATSTSKQMPLTIKNAICYTCIGHHRWHKWSHIASLSIWKFDSEDEPPCWREQFLNDIDVNTTFIQIEFFSLILGDKCKWWLQIWNTVLVLIKESLKRFLHFDNRWTHLVWSERSDLIVRIARRHVW